MAQYTPEWWEIRRGKPTASAFDRIVTPGGKASSQARKYLTDLIGEMVRYDPAFLSSRPVTRDMEYGTQCEPQARNWYAMERDEATIQQVGFCTTDDERLGCSPDALVNPVYDGTQIVATEGVLELKCPSAGTHVGYIEDPESLLADYRPQVHGHLIVTGAKWVDLVSFAPELQPVIVRVVPDEYTVRLGQALIEFAESLAARRRVILEGGK